MKADKLLSGCHEILQLAFRNVKLISHFEMWSLFHISKCGIFESHLVVKILFWQFGIFWQCFLALAVQFQICQQP